MVGLNETLRRLKAKALGRNIKMLYFSIFFNNYLTNIEKHLHF